MKILCKFPTRGRPNKFTHVFYQYQSLARSGNIDFLVTIDKDDRMMLNPQLHNTMKQWGNTTIQLIDPCGKIGAINAGVSEVIDNYDIILLASDDMIPQVEGYDEVIIKDMEKHFPDTDGVLWYYDGYTKDLNTLCVLGRKYFKRFGYIYEPSYKSFWCDNEFMEVADKLGKQKYFERTIIKHENPVWNNTIRYDSLNMRDMANFEHDKQIYETRKENNFGQAAIIEYFDSDHSKPEGKVRQADTGTGKTDKRGRARKKGPDMQLE